MGNPTPEDVSMAARSSGQGGSSLSSPAPGNKSSTLRTTRSAGSTLDILKALAVIQDGLRQFVMAGGMARQPMVNDKGVMVMAIKLNGHDLGIGPDGNFLVDGRSVMESRPE